MTETDEAGPVPPAGGTGSTVPPPPAAGTARRPALRRPRRGRILGGLAAGTAAHLGVDVSIVRIVFVVVTVITNGLGLLAYLAGLLIVPADDDRPGTQPPASPSARTGTPRDTAFWLGVGLLVLGAVLLSGPLAPGRLLGGLAGPDVLVAVVLIAFGLALWRSAERRDPRPVGTPVAAVHPDTRPSTTPTTEHDMTTPPQEGDREAASSAGSPPTRQPSVPTQVFTPPPLPSSDRSVLGRITVGIVLVAVGVLWIVRTAGIAAISAGQLLSAALLVVGLGLVVGAFAGRARWLVLVGLLLVPLVLAAELLRPIGAVGFPEIGLQEGAGDVRQAPVSLDELDEGFRLGAGRLVVDLGELEVDGEVATSAAVGAGELIVILPDDVRAEVDARVGVGELTVGDVSGSGFGVARTATVTVGDGSGSIALDLQVGFGELRVEAPGPDASGSETDQEDQ